MSVLIKGMKMPKSCWDCDFCHNIPYCGVEDLYRCTAQETKQIMPLKSERDESCPLEEVPAGDVVPAVHGKWILAVDSILSDILQTMIEFVDMCDMKKDFKEYFQGKITEIDMELCKLMDEEESNGNLH